MAAINLVGIGASFPNPGTFLELDFAQGATAGFGGQRACLLIGNAGAAGNAIRDTVVYGPDTPVPCQTEADVTALFANGSQLHRMFLRFAPINKTTPLYFLAVTSSVGAAALGTLSVGGVANNNGTLRVWVVDQFVDTPITSGQTPAQIITAVAASINTQTRWPVTATAGTPNASSLNVLAVGPGPEGNWIRWQSGLIPNVSFGVTVSPGANAFLAGGTTADVNTTALSTIAAARYYYIASGDSDATNLGRIVTQVNTQALPTTGIRQRVIGGSMDTLANTTTTATGLNAARAELIWGVATDWTPAELAAMGAALYSALEPSSQPGVARKNFSLFPTPQGADTTLWNNQLVPPTRGGAAVAPTVAQITSALNNGITPIALVNAQTQLVKRCTTRSLNGAVNDYRIRDAHKVTVCDYWCDDAVALTQTQFGGKDILPDPAVGQPPPPSIAVTPGIWGGALKGLVTRYDNAGQWASTQTQGGVAVRGGTTINNNAIIQAETNPPTRMSALFPLQPVNIADQFLLLVQQVS